MNQIRQLASSLLDDFKSAPTTISLTLAAITLTPLFLHIRHRHRICHQQRVRLKHSHVWVIGSSQGLGSELVKVLHDEKGVRKLTISSRNESKLHLLKSSLLSNNAHSNKSSFSQVVNVLPFDIRQHDNATLQRSIPRDVDIVILNAGINQNDQPFPALDIDRIDAIIDTNFRGTVRTVHFLLPALIQRRSSATVCVVSSLAAYRGVPGASVYGATKAALSCFCESLAIELKALDVDVNVLCVHPGFIDTPAIEGLDHPKPFVMSARRAARTVVDAIQSRTRSSAMGFPAVMEYVVMPFAAIVPSRLYNAILAAVFRRELQRRGSNKAE